VLAAIVFVATTGCTWRQLPPVFGPSGPTVHRRFTEWTAARVWAKLHRLILDELGSCGEFPGASYVGPGGFGELRGAPTLVGRAEAASDVEAARRLWTLSEELTGVEFPVGVGVR